jgi:hypothetical protein
VAAAWMALGGVMVMLVNAWSRQTCRAAVGTSAIALIVLEISIICCR